MLFFAMEKTEQCCGFVEFNVLDGTPENKNGSPYCNLAYLVFSDLQLSFVEVGIRFSFSGEIAAERKEYEIKKRKKMLCA